MAANPFAGTVFEESWKQGFSVGFLQPREIHLPPTPLAPEQHPAYAAGVVAGQTVSLGVNVPPDDPGGHEAWKTILEDAKTVAHSGHTGREIGKALFLKNGRFAAFARTTGVFAILQFVEIAIWGPERQPFFEEAAAQALGRTRRQLQENGIISSAARL